MTRTFTRSLGASQIVGKQSIDRTQRFREQLCCLLKKPASVSLITVQDAEAQSRGVTAIYDADDPDAAAWVKQAEVVSGELWAKLMERRKCVGR